MSSASARDDRISTAQAKAAILREALPWITRFHNATVVVKYGGSAMVEDDLKRSFAADIALLHFVGLRPVVVHGGGPQISEVSDRFRIRTRFIDGLRVTDDATMDVVRMVLLGKVNPELVGLIAAAGAPAMGVAGTDAALFEVERAVGSRGEDLGRVGEIRSVDATVLERLLDDGFVPVVATVGRDHDGLDRNVNADAAAGAVAVALRAAKLIYLTDVAGAYRDFDDETSLLSQVSLERLSAMVDDGEFQAGMRPKATAILDALRGGVPRAHILDGRVLHAILLEAFTDEGVGTMFTNDTAPRDRGRPRGGRRS